MNLDVLGFEWFIAPHDAIEVYFEQINSELVLDTVRHFYIIHNGYSAKFIFVEDFKDGGVAKGYYFGGTTYEVASEPERIKEAEEGIKIVAYDTVGETYEKFDVTGTSM